eukprot:scaffold242443_cov22-Tisochrysis_lutea.AAC.1
MERGVARACASLQTTIDTVGSGRMTPSMAEAQGKIPWNSPWKCMAHNAYPHAAALFFRAEALSCASHAGTLNIPKQGIWYDGQFVDGKPVQTPTKLNIFWWGCAWTPSAMVTDSV